MTTRTLYLQRNEKSQAKVLLSLAMIMVSFCCFKCAPPIVCLIPHTQKMFRKSSHIVHNFLVTKNEIEKKKNKITTHTTQKTSLFSISYYLFFSSFFFCVRDKQIEMSILCAFYGIECVCLLALRYLFVSFFAVSGFLVSFLITN